MSDCFHERYQVFESLEESGKPKRRAARKSEVDKNGDAARILELGALAQGFPLENLQNDILTRMLSRLSAWDLLQVSAVRHFTLIPDRLHENAGVAVNKKECVEGYSSSPCRLAVSLHRQASPFLKQLASSTQIGRGALKCAPGRQNASNGAASTGMSPLETTALLELLTDEFKQPFCLSTNSAISAGKTHAEHVGLPAR